MPSRAATAPPMFFLFGEPRRTVGPRFLHVEDLAERSLPNDWNIRPHAHADLHHLFAIDTGGGEMTADGARHAFAAPTLLVVPCGTVHGFLFGPDTHGQVLTVAEAYLRDLAARQPAIGGVFASAVCLKRQGADGLPDRLARLARELVWTAPGHAAAIEGDLLCVLVEALRLRGQAAPDAPAVHDRHAALVARFRARVEAQYRSGTSVDRYAVALGVSVATLRRACALHAGCAPAQLVLDRIFLEAQRILLYTNMTIAEASLFLGIDDTAYFSRFFTRRAGRSPRAFRADHAGK